MWDITSKLERIELRNKIGDQIIAQYPCGGFEYSNNAAGVWFRLWHEARGGFKSVTLRSDAEARDHHRLTLKLLNDCYSDSGVLGAGALASAVIRLKSEWSLDYLRAVADYYRRWWETFGHSFQTPLFPFQGHTPMFFFAREFLRQGALPTWADEAVKEDLRFLEEVTGSPVQQQWEDNPEAYESNRSFIETARFEALILQAEVTLYTDPHRALQDINAIESKKEEVASFALARNKNSALSYYHTVRGLALSAAGNTNAAMIAFEKAAALEDPKSPLYDGRAAKHLGAAVVAPAADPSALGSWKRMGTPIPIFIDNRSFDGYHPLNEKGEITERIWIGADLSSDCYLANFWATWCGPCRGELPELTKLFLEGWPVIAFNVDADRLGVRPYLRQNKVALPVVLGGSAWYRDLERTTGLNTGKLPKTVIICDGVVVAEAFGGFNAEQAQLWRTKMREGMAQFGIIPSPPRP